MRGNGTGASSGISLVPQQKPLIESMPIPEQKKPWIEQFPSSPLDFPNITDLPIPEQEKPFVGDLPPYDGPNATVFPFPLEQESYFPPIVCAKGDSGYKAPEGGGGVSDTIHKGDKDVTFGHGGRHLDGTGLTAEEVNQAIANDVITKNVVPGQFVKGQVKIGGVTIEYTSKNLGNGTINVGTYYVV